MAHSRIIGICDRCGGQQTSLRRFCKPCRVAMQSLSNEYNKNNHGFSGLVNQQNMERWFFWARHLLVDRKKMPDTFARHVAYLVKRCSFQVPPESQTRPRNYQQEQQKQDALDLRPGKHNSHKF